MDGHENFSQLSRGEILFSFTQRFSMAWKPIKLPIRVFYISLSGVRQPERQAILANLENVLDP